LAAVRVFLIEDSPRTLELVQEILARVGGFRVVGVAANETAATEWLLKHRQGWDLAIVDLLLQEGSGFTLLSRCRREPGTVLVFSDFVTAAIEDRCLRLGADAVLSKADFSALRSYLQDLRDATAEAAA
jgi:DNA-binding NarL/FixJ family response regulator